MATPSPHLGQRAGSNMSHHCGIQDKGIKRKTRHKNRIPREVCHLQERETEQGGAGTSFEPSMNKSQYFSSLGHFIFLVNVCFIS